MDEPQQQSEMLINMGARVAAFLMSLAVVSLVVRYIVGVFRNSRKWIQDQVRNAIRKEMQ